MIQVEYRLKLGQDEFVIKGDFKNEKEFFQRMAFFSSLPKTAPNGATDLKLVVRETKKGTYYSLISEQEKMEFQLGQHKEGDTLYAKDWVPLFQGEADGEEQAPAPAFGQKTQAAAPAQGFKTAAKQASAPAPAFGQAAPQAATPAPSFNMPQPQAQSFAAPAQQAATAQTPAPAAPAPTTNPQVAAVANNVLSRFGIKQ